MEEGVWRRVCGCVKGVWSVCGGGCAGVWRRVCGGCVKQNINGNNNKTNNI